MAILAVSIRGSASALTATACVAAACITTMHAPALAAPVSYAVDPGHTYASFEVDHLGLSTARGRFNRTSGSIVLDPNGDASYIEIVIDTASVDTGHTKRDEHLRAAAFFDVDSYPTMKFVASALRFDGNRLIAANGHLTMLGKTLPTSLEITRFNCALHPIRKTPACGADAIARIRRSDWGMTTYVPTIGDEVTIRIGVEAFALP